MPALQPQEAQCHQTLRLCIRERAGRAVSVGAGGLLEEVLVEVLELKNGGANEGEERGPTDRQTLN